MARPRSVAALGALLGLLTVGCGHLSPQTIAAHKIADVLPQVIGPARHYDVQVDGDPFALTRGRAQHVHVTGEDVQVTPTTTLDTLDFVAQDVSFDTKANRLDHIGRTDFTATLGQEHLSEYLAQTRVRPGVTVTLRQSDLQIQLPVSAGPIHTTVTVTGSVIPTAPGASTVNFIADRARLSFLPVPVFAVNAALGELNPVVDLSRLKVPLALNGAEVVDGKLTFRGTADLNALAATP